MKEMPFPLLVPCLFVVANKINSLLPATKVETPTLRVLLINSRWCKHVLPLTGILAHFRCIHGPWTQLSEKHAFSLGCRTDIFQTSGVLVAFSLFKSGPLESASIPSLPSTWQFPFFPCSETRRKLGVQLLYLGVKHNYHLDWDVKGGLWQ